MAYKYKLNVVNPEKNIVSLKPTSGTYLKAFAYSAAPGLVFWGAAVLISKIAEERRAHDANDDPKTVYRTN